MYSPNGNGFVVHCARIFADILALETPFPAYNGEDDFVFTCYSHQDAALVYQEIEQLHSAGINIWYDEGIRPGAEWTDELATAIRNCKSLVLFATPQSVNSKHCRDEVQYALKHNKSIIVIYLEATELPPGLELMLGSLHAVEKGHHDNARYLELILQALNQPDTAPPDASTQFTPKSRAPVKSTQSAKTTHLTSGRAKYAYVAVVLTLLGLGFWWSTSQQETTAPGEAGVSVALLPFEDRGGFENNSYYPESFSEDLLNRLVAVDGLRVASRRSSFNFDLGNPNTSSLPNIAKQLNVEALVVGYLRRSGDLLRLSVELIDVSNGKEEVRWSDAYDQVSMNTMLSIQNEITRQIGETLLPEGLSSVSIERLARISTDSPEAFQFYLEASDILRRPLDDPAILDEATRLFNAAIALDGNYAWAKAGLCNAMRLKYQESVGDFEPMQEACEALKELPKDIFESRLALGAYYKEVGKHDLAINELHAAIALNKHSADAQLELARVLASKYDVTRDDLDKVQAEQAYLQAIKTEPDYWYGHHTYAIFLTKESRLNDAKEQLHKALNLAPTSVASLNNLAGVQYRLGEIDAAEENWQKSLKISADNLWAYSGLGVLYYYGGDYAKAAEYFAEGARVSPQDYDIQGRLGEALRLIPDRTAQAKQAFQRAIALAKQRLKNNPTNWRLLGILALYHAYIGDHEAAQAYLKDMYAYSTQDNPLIHYWAALVAFTEGKIDEVFENLDESLKQGYYQQKKFIIEEPVLQEFYTKHPKRFAALMSKY